MKKIIRFILLLIIISVSLNLYMILSVKDQIYSIDDIDINDFDCILVLGAGIRNNRPSPMLEDRLTTSIKAYNNHLAPKILVSGDHTAINYDEVNVMKNYLIENNIPSEDVFMDHAGISSYDSIYRSKKIFKANKVLIITQKYHLYRALYIANKLDLEAYGIAADQKIYNNQYKRDIREFFARIKDFFKCINKPESTYLGEAYSISGNGDKTNDINALS